MNDSTSAESCPKESDEIGKETSTNKLLHESSENSAETTPTNCATLFCSNLHPRIAEPHLEKLFRRHGAIARIHLSRNGGMHRGYAFIEYRNKEDARSAVAKLHGRMLLGRSLVVKFARSPKVNVNVTRVGSTTVSESGNDNTPRRREDVSRKIAAVRRAIEVAKERTRGR